MRVQFRSAAALAVLATALSAPAGSWSADAVQQLARQPPSVVLDNKEAKGILGKEVRSSTGEDMGRIVNVIVGQAGQVRAAVIDFGGFLGVGSRKIAVDWNMLSFVDEGKVPRITVGLTRDEVKAAPEYKDGRPVVVVGAVDETKLPPAEDAVVMPEM